MNTEFRKQNPEQGPELGAFIIIIMDISMAHDPLAKSRAQCPVEKEAEKCIDTYNGQVKCFRPYDRQTTQEFTCSISVNKPKLSVTKKL